MIFGDVLYITNTNNGVVCNKSKTNDISIMGHIATMQQKIETLENELLLLRELLKAKDDLIEILKNKKGDK